MHRQLAILGEFTPSFAPHAATNAAIAHACAASGLDVRASWISTEAIDAALFTQFDGIWVAPGSPYKNMAKTLWAIRAARENGVPCLGTCGGFQHIILEYARNVLGFADAQHAECAQRRGRVRRAVHLAPDVTVLVMIPHWPLNRFFFGSCSTFRSFGVGFR